MKDSSKKIILASVIIPAKNRQKLLQRAIDSVISSNGSEQVEIIVIDDNSKPELSPSIRKQDKIIRLDVDSGAAVARNRGIDVAKGDLIYLLDSDDYFIERDFYIECLNYSESEGLYYSAIESGNYKSNFPEKICSNEYIKCVLFRYPYITQTSSLFFPAKMKLRFDETLPKHQDWDFVFSTLRKGYQVKSSKFSGRVFFDRDDKGSLSRQPIASKSYPWLSKLEKSNTTQGEIDMVKFHILGKYSEYAWSSFLKYFFTALPRGNSSIFIMLKILIHKIILQFRL